LAFLKSIVEPEEKFSTGKSWGGGNSSFPPMSGRQCVYWSAV